MVSSLRPSPQRRGHPEKGLCLVRAAVAPTPGARRERTWSGPCGRHPDAVGTPKMNLVWSMRPSPQRRGQAEIELGLVQAAVAPSPWARRNCTWSGPCGRRPNAAGTPKNELGLVRAAVAPTPWARRKRIWSGPCGRRPNAVGTPKNELGLVRAAVAPTPWARRKRTWSGPCGRRPNAVSTPKTNLIWSVHASPQRW